MPNSVIFLFVLTAITNIAGAQPMNSFQDHYTKFYSYSTNQGLSSSEVLDILEDQYGFIWVATKNGLNKFDGQEFFQYFKNTNPNSLPDNLVTSLAEDINGTIWIGTQNGLCRYVRSKNCFEIIASEPELPDLEIRALYADKKGNLWIETRRGGLNCYDISTKKLVTYPHRPLVFEGDYFYHFIFEDSKQRIWIGGRNFAPKYLNIETKTFAPSKAFRGNDGSSIFEDKNHIVWTSGNYGYTYFNERTGNLDDSTQFQFPFRIQAALNAGDGKIWFGGDGDKVFLYDQNYEKWTFFSHSDTNPFSIISTKVNKIYNDNRDNIWIATSDGLSVCPSEINKFRHYRYIQGVSGSLSSNNATAILQDKTGTIWIGTQDNGVDTLCLASEQARNLKYGIIGNRIDENTFVKENQVLKKYFCSGLILPNQSKQAANLLKNYASYVKANLKFSAKNENHVSALYEDSEGTIYIGLWDGVGFNKFNRKDGFKREYLYEVPGSNLFFDEISGANFYNDFLEDRQKNFWIATWEGIGLNLYNRTTNEFSGANFHGGQFSNGHPFYSLVNSDDSLIWLQNSSSFLGYFNILSGKYTAFISDRILKDNRLASVRKYLPFSGFTPVNIPLADAGFHILNDGQNIWIVFNSTSITRYNQQKAFFNNYDLSNKKEEVSIVVYSPGEKKIYFCTVSGLIYSFSIITNQSEKLPIPSKYLAKNVASMAYFDDKLWVAYDDSLLVFTPQDTQTEIIGRIGQDVGKAIKINVMSGFSNKLFLGSLNEIFIFDKTTRQFENLTQKAGFNQSVSNFTAFSFDEKILRAGSDNGLFRFDLAEGKVEVFKHDEFDKESLPDDEITALCPVKNQLYIATRGGLCVVDKLTNRITRLNQIPSTILSTRLLTRLMEDRDGFVWIGTSEKGVNRMNPVTSQFDHFYEIPGDTASISGNYVESIFQDSDGNIWIGTDKALNRFNQQTKTFARYVLFDEFNLGPIKAIKEDGNKNLWISTTNGLARFNRETGDVVHLTGLNGLQDNTFSNGATKLRDGRLAFGGLNGVSVFDPAAIIPDKSFPKILIENAKINDSIQFVDFSEQDSLILSHSQNNISFMLGTSEYFSPELIKFRYRLKGLEALWSNTTIKNNQIKYNNLKPGYYLLEITSTNVYGKWNPKLQTCYIQIKNPWWSTWWFMVLSVFTFAGFIVVLIWVREKNLKEAKRKLEKKVKERTTELAESVEKLQLSEANLAEAVAAKDKFFSIIAHDLKNPVLALQHISDKLVTEYGKLSPQQQAELLSSMNRQIHLTYSFLDNLLLWSLSQKNAIVFRPEVIRLYDIISEVIVLLDENARFKDIEIGNSVADTLYVFADKNMVFIILSNLVNNAIKFSYPKSKVHIEAIDEGANLKIRVKDNGVGIPPEQIPKLFTITSKFRTMGTQKESGTGTGLLICKEFVEKNGGKISVKSIQDSESIFYFTLPKANHQ